VRTTWGVEVINSWGLSEAGVCAFGCGAGAGMHLNEDLVIVEPVDAEGRRARSGNLSQKIYLTNLYNHTLPLIRYEITDRVMLLDEPCSCGSTLRRIADVQGRLDDCFRDPHGRIIHPAVFASPLSREPNVLEYQVQQTRQGARVCVRCRGAIDARRLERELVDGLREAGVADPRVEILAVEAIARTPAGKLKRFVPLAGELARGP
jgi:phenylacetate-CoA ligase